MVPRQQGRRVLITVWDGLRPDMVNDENTPTLVRLARQGVWFENSHACFPTDTRVNAACLATGARPGVHGIVGNELYVPELDPRKAVSTAQREVLQRIADVSNGRPLDIPTLSEIVQDHGLTAASACSGSAGTATLSNYAKDSIILHPEFCQPSAFEEYIYGRFGRAASDARAERVNKFAVDVFTEHLLAEVQAELSILWLTTPDHVQHRGGLGSREALASIRSNDAHLKRVLKSLEANGLGELTDILVCSNHGFSTGSTEVAVEEALVGLDLGPQAGNAVVAASGVFVPDGDLELVNAVATCLQCLDGIGAIWTAGGAVEGTLNRAGLYPDHPRAPGVVYSPAWDDTSNEFGVAGSSRGGGRAKHGTSSPTDIRNVLVAAGESFRRGIRSDVPVGIVDIAPTALWLLGIIPPGTMEGRVIEEALEGGPDPSGVPWELRSEEAATQVRGKRYEAWAEYACVEGRTYLRQAGARGE